MNTGPVDALRCWSAEHKERLGRVGISLEYVESANAESRSARVDLESEAVIGRATVWDSGFCDLELLSVETGMQLLFHHHDQIAGAGIAALLNDLTSRMSTPT